MINLIIYFTLYNKSSSKSLYLEFSNKELNITNTLFFFQAQQTPDDRIFFDHFKKQKLFFSYFSANKKYYLFLYNQKLININFLYQPVGIVRKSNSKKRKIPSLKGFFFCALKTMKTG